jgi:cyclopropane fatty-acyl-phospholipid synthase-like methyltransferase
MTNLPDKDVFAKSYAGKAPWDIGGPQQPFVDAAEQITGTILDAGCGTGENALFFAQRGHAVTGVDFLEEPIRRARQKAAERGLAADFLVRDALQLRELPAQFDNVIDCGLFHVFSDDDRRQYVAGLASIVKSGGQVWLMCFSDEEPPGAGPRRISKADLAAAFAPGWTIESITPSHFQVIAEFKDMFSPTGPKAWFVVVRRD